MSGMTLNDILGGEFNYYGAYRLRFKLDDMVWEAKPTSSDFEATTVTAFPSDHGFWPSPLARVRVETFCDEDFTGCQLMDVTKDYWWLRFGPDDSTEDYAPCFRFVSRYASVPPPGTEG